MNLQILFPNASARLLAFPTFNDFNGPTQFGCTVSNEDGLQELCPAGGHAVDTWLGMLWRMLKCAVSADSRPIKAPHRTRFKTLSTAVDSWNGRLMIIMFCILKHSTLAKNSRQGWDLFIGMIPILQELQVLILFISVVFFEHLELQRWPGQRSCRRTEFDSAALTGKQFKHICGTPVRDALKRCS